jgi:hypothetical protein
MTAALALLLFAAGVGAGYAVALRRTSRQPAAGTPPACASAVACVAPPTPSPRAEAAVPAIAGHAARRSKPSRATPTALEPLPERKPLADDERTRALRAFATKKAPELRDCIDEPDRGPALELGAAFEIGANGVVELVQILGADGAPKEVRRCYSSHLKKWRFPAELLRGEEKLLVNFVL